MNKIPKLEINCIPSQLNTSKATGVASQLANIAEQQPNYDGITIEQMRGNPLYQRIDDIDKIGLAKDAMQKAAQTIKSNRQKIRYVNELGQKMQKPKK